MQLDEVGRAIGRIEGTLCEMQRSLHDIRDSQETMNARMNKVEGKIIGVSSMMGVVSAFIAAKIREWMGGC